MRRWEDNENEKMMRRWWR